MRRIRGAAVASAPFLVLRGSFFAAPAVAPRPRSPILVESTFRLRPGLLASLVPAVLWPAASLRRPRLAPGGKSIRPSFSGRNPAPAPSNGQHHRKETLLMPRRMTVALALMASFTLCL